MSEKKRPLKIDKGEEGMKDIREEFPENSHKSKTKQEKKVKKVTTGKVIQKKKSLGRRFADTFVGEDIDNVSSYIIHDVLVPAAKSTISDAVQGAIEMILFGERRGDRTRRDRGRSYVSYDKKSYNAPERRDISHKNRSRHNFDDIVLSTRGEAEEVLSHLVDLTIDYGEASVGDLYDLVGITGEFTDRKWGWLDLSKASVSRGRDGYLLDLPKPILID